MLETWYRYVARSQAVEDSRWSLASEWKLVARLSYADCQKPVCHTCMPISCFHFWYALHNHPNTWLYVRLIRLGFSTEDEEGESRPEAPKVHGAIEHLSMLWGGELNVLMQDAICNMQHAACNIIIIRTNIWKWRYCEDVGGMVWSIVEDGV